MFVASFIDQLYFHCKSSFMNHKFTQHKMRAKNFTFPYLPAGGRPPNSSQYFSDKIKVIRINCDLNYGLCFPRNVARKQWGWGTSKEVNELQYDACCGHWLLFVAWHAEAQFGMKENADKYGDILDNKSNTLKYYCSTRSRQIESRSNRWSWKR